MDTFKKQVDFRLADDHKSGARPATARRTDIPGIAASLLADDGKAKNPPGVNREGVGRFSSYFFICVSTGIRIP